MRFIRKVLSLCGSFRAYRAVCELPLTTSIKYLVTLMAWLSLFLVLTFIPVLLTTIRQIGGWVEANLPPFRIEDGQVRSDVTQPYFGGNKDFRIILDTTGQTTAVDSNATQGILIKSASWVFWMTHAKDKDVLTQERTFKGFPNGDVNRQYLIRWIRLTLPVALPMMFLIALLLGLLITLVQAYLFAVMVGVIMTRSADEPLQMPHLLNIAMHAVTPAAIIVTIYTALQLNELNLGLIYFAAYGIFLLGATSACRSSAEDEDEDVEA